jgi:hypothetical protein
VAGIARDNNVKKVTKSKSMVSEEVNLNDKLEAAGIQVIETDLGEYILQLAHEPPSHIVAPAVHKSKEEVADLFHAAHHKPRLTDIAAMTREAREALREHFLTADMGISGSNFVIAETGTTLTVTNEGNADLVDDDAAHPLRDHRHREGDPDARGFRDADPPAAALGDRPVDRQLPHAHHGREAPGRDRRARSRCTSCSWTRAARSSSAARCRRCCAASVAARA